MWVTNVVVSHQCDSKSSDINQHPGKVSNQQSTLGANMVANITLSVASVMLHHIVINQTLSPIRHCHQSYVGIRILILHERQVMKQSI